jgi:hypothetical protein
VPADPRVLSIMIFSGIDPAQAIDAVHRRRQ